jgi:hypothetical protein
MGGNAVPLGEVTCWGRPLERGSGQGGGQKELTGQQLAVNEHHLQVRQ